MVKVERGTMIRKILPPMFLSLLSAFGLTACGDDDKKKEDDENSQYVVMPFVVGDTATINGATAEKFTIEKGADAAATGAKLTGKETFDALYMNDQVAEHEARTLLNRFDGKKGQAQGAWFWSTARRLDAYYGMKSGKGMQFFAGDGTGPTEAAYRAWASQTAKVAPPSFKMTAATCPEAGDEIEVPAANGKMGDGETRPVDVPEGGAEDATDFCLVYIDDPTTAGSKEAVKATVKTVIDRFKTVIYKDAFAAVGDYTFKPIVVVIDFADADKWPQAEAFQIAGAFLPQIAATVKQPILFMASKSKETDAAKATKVWHGTVAHEMQHAVMDYFKTQKGKLEGGEIPAIDEGLAHLIEDMFGYGQENFGGFAKAFLSTWYDADLGGAPVINAEDTGPSSRGAAQAFWYYMQSQKGGITFASGVAASGGGLEFIAKAVKSGKRGVANLAEAYGGTWTDVVSGFYGALVLDGATLAEGVTIEDKYKVQDIQTISDLNGNTDKKFGMHFNGYEGLAATHDWALKADTTTKIEDVSYYTTVPLLYTGAAVDGLTYTSEGKTVTTAKVKIK